jgi:hypothetical protein
VYVRSILTTSDGACRINETVLLARLPNSLLIEVFVGRLFFVTKRGAVVFLGQEGLYYLDVLLNSGAYCRLYSLQRRLIDERLTFKKVAI